MNEKLFLTTDLAERLYEQVARDLPIIDYHNHLGISDLAGHRQYADIYELWIAPDPYKHRLMRICGIEEAYITGKKSNYEKFCKWCSIFPDLIGTPVYDWSRMELERVFHVELIPSTETAMELWNRTNELLKTPEYSADNLLKKFSIEYAAPCASICDELTVFANISAEYAVPCAGDRNVIAPSLRGDDIVVPDAGFLNRLQQASGVIITDLHSFESALENRIENFDQAGCRFSDHALDEGFWYVSDDGKNDSRFQRILRGEHLSREDQQALSCEILRRLGSIYAKAGWVMQLHMGALRYTSSRLRSLAGAQGGFAGIGNSVPVASLTRLLDDLEQKDCLPKTLLFSLNPVDNAMLAVLSGSYSRDGVPALISQGPAWWWCDHINGMKEMLDRFCSFGVLSTFLGMTTDSRSILSFVRHEYFRRVLCMWIGEKAARGEFPDSYELWKPIVEKICYQNAKVRI